MQLTAKNLTQHLKQPSLLPVYLICGSTTLLVNEARDQLRKRFEELGYQQCELFFADSSNDWQAIANNIDNLSLFSDKTLLEVRNPNAKFNDSTVKLLTQYLKNPPEDKRMMIVTHKLTAAQKKTRWYKTIDQHGAVITIWPVNMRELPSWISQRLKQANLRADRDSIALLAELTEGNLLATQQAIEKLRLLYSNDMITTQAITATISDNGRFNVFDLTTYALLGQSARVTRVIAGLRFTGTEATLTLWALARELRELYALSCQLEHGKPIAQVLASQWQMRKQPLKMALSRLNKTTISRLLQKAQRIDQITKGMSTGNAWQELESLSLSMCDNKRWAA